MKTVNVKKFLTIHSKLLIVLLLYTVVTAHTQSSPEAIIGQTPDLPSAKTLAAYAGSDNEAAQQQVRAFLKKIREIDSVYTRSVTPEITDADIADVKAQA
ncbi:MAG: hypothetical protein LBD59_02615, partial [Prevotellaceae bacterium]|nr:hypothetical protein [Prevotellaceae bacterium]